LQPSAGTRSEYRTVAVADVNADRRSDVVVEVTDVSTRVKSWIVMLASNQASTGDPTFVQQDNWVPPPMGDSNGYRAIGLLDFDDDPSRLPDLLFVRRDPVTLDYGLYVATNAGGSFNSVALWYQDAALPSIIGLEEDGLTRLANDTSELMQFVGVTNTYFTRKQFSDFLAAKNLNLAQGSDLKAPNRQLEQDGCQINYDPPKVEASTDEIYDVPYQARAEVKYGFLTCNVQISDRLSLKMQVLYGGCSGSAGVGTLGVSGGCEVGLFKETLEADLTPPPPLNVPTKADVTVKGPNANAKGSFGFKPDGLITGDKVGFDGEAGAELASVSASAEVSGIKGGGKLAIGVGIGGGMGIEDGVLSGEIKLAFLVGGSIEFSLDGAKAAKGFYKVGKTAYTFAGDAANESGKFVVYTAGPAVYDAASQIGGAVEDEAEKAGRVVLTEAGEAVYFIAGADGKRTFLIFTDTAGRTIVAIFNALEDAATNLAEGAVSGIVFLGNGLSDAWAWVFD